MVDLLSRILGVMEYLIGCTLAEQAWADVIVSQEFEEALLIEFPESVFGHASLIAFDLMGKVDLVDLEQDGTDIAEN